MKTTLGSLTLTLMIAGTLVAGSLNAAGRSADERGRFDGPQRPGAGAKKDLDNPSARGLWRDQWYNESYVKDGRKTKRQGGSDSMWSPAYLRFMMDAAKRERTRYAAKMPISGTSQVMLDPSAPIAGNVTAKSAATSLSRDLRWTNIGPTKANFATNGVTLNVTDSGRVRNIVTDPANPNIIYVAFSGGGVWKSTDGGAFWQAKTETLGTLSIGALVMDPNDSSTLYLGLGDPFDGTGVGVVKLTNGGDTWTDPVFLGNSTSVRDVLVAPGNSNIVLAATDRGLYRSTDAGKTYAAVSIATGVAEAPGVWSLTSGGGNTMVLSLEAAPTATTTTPSSRDGQVWRSTDAGATWTRATGVTNAAGLNRISLVSAPSNRSVMYAMAAKSTTSTTRSRDFGNIFKSTDGGANWTAIATTSTGTYRNYTNTNSESSSIETILGGQGFYNHMLVVDRTNPDLFYVGGQLLMARAQLVSGSYTFTQLTNWLAQFSLAYVHADLHAGHIASNGTMYIGSDGGISRSTNNGTSFTSVLNEGIASHLVYNVCSTPADTNRVLIGLQDNGTRLRETNTSIFNQVVGGDGFGCNVNPSNANTMIGSVQFLSIRKSTNGGSSFSTACSGITECGNSSTAPFKTTVLAWAGDATGNTLYTQSLTRVYRSTNYASSWTALGTTGLPASTTTAPFVIRGIGVAKTNGASPNSDTVVGLVANGGRVFLTTDRGANWTAAGALPNNDSSLSSITFDPSNRNIVYVTSVAPDSTKTHVWRSTNFGATWAAIDGNGFPTGIPVNAITIDPVVPTSLYAATHLGIYRSLDSGTNWQRFGALLPLVEVTDIAVSANGNQVRAATFGRSVWELSNITNNVAPVANFTSTTSNLTASFTDTSSDSDGTIVRRQWNYGDGVNSSTTSPTHTYAAPGTYTVTLTVTDNGGYSNTRTATVTVAAGSNVAPVANFTSTTSALTANFTDTSTDSDGTIASRSWNFGDGTSSTLTNPSKTYAAAGTYTVTLTVTDNGGLSNTRTAAVTVSAPANAAPTANFTFATSGLTANFTDTSTDSDGTIASRSWNFGDSTTSTATNPSKTYTAAGTYTVTLTVTDNGGATNTRTQSVTVTASAVQTYSNTSAIAIPDNNNTGVTRTIAVSGRTGNAPTNAAIAVNITHPYIGDLIVDLIAPDGSVYNLHNRTGSSADNIVQTYTRNLSTEALNGTWSLRVRDRASQDVGTLNNWSITF
jgi:PKD repeat protein